MEWNSDADGILASGVQAIEPTSSEELQLSIDILMRGMGDVDAGNDRND